MSENIPKGRVTLRSSKYTPYYSYIGIVLFILTLVVNLSFGFKVSSDEGVLFLLSVSNAGLLLFTLGWGVFGIIEVYLILKTKTRLKSRLHHGKISTEEYMISDKSFTFSLVVSISYLFLILIQIGYVIIHWDEVNV